MQILIMIHSWQLFAGVCRCLPVITLYHSSFILHLFPVGCMSNLFVIRSNLFSRARSAWPVGRFGCSSAHNALINRIPNGERCYSRKAAYSRIWKNPWGLQISTSFMDFHLNFYSTQSRSGFGVIVSARTSFKTIFSITALTTPCQNQYKLGFSEEKQK